MTAINVVLKRDGALIMTDAAVYDQGGRILGFGQKAVAMPTLKAAVAVRGGQLQTAFLALELPLHARSFDELTGDLEAFGDLIRRTLSSYENVCSWRDVQVVVVGFSDKFRRGRGFVYDSMADTAEEIDGYAFGPLPNEEEFANLHSIGCEIDADVSPANFRADRHGIPLMEAQRRMRTTVAGMDGEYHIVGGNILVTEISADGVAQRVIHEWGDEAGHPLKPEPFRIDSYRMTQTLSRQQRRALERQAGRIAA